MAFNIKHGSRVAFSRLLSFGFQGIIAASSQQPAASSQQPAASSQQPAASQQLKTHPL